MATPTASRHRDLEQIIKDLQQQVRALTAASLRRRQLGVTEGDFVVSGGGGVIVEDGGSLAILRDNPEWPEYRTVLGARTDPLDPTYGWVDVGASPPDRSAVFRLNVGVREFISLYSDGDVSITGTDSVTLGAPLIYLGGGNTQIQHNTTGSAANCRIETDGTILRVSSSLRYKADVGDADVDPAAVLRLRGRTWVDKSAEGDPDAKHQVGFIAEELHDAGLVQFVEYDDEGRPDAIQYDRLSVGLLAVVKSQQALLDALTARLEALEAKA